MVKRLLVLFLLTSCGYSNWVTYDLHLEDDQDNKQVIAIIDTGLSSQLLKKYDDRILDVYNVIDSNFNVEDHHGHGSDMFLLGASLKQGIYKRGQYIIIKAINEQGETSPHYLLLALKKAEEMEADIVNMSLGGVHEDIQVNKQLEHMRNKGTYLLAATGDFGDKDVLYPANNENVIGVGAYDKDHEIWKQCNIGKGLDCLFPGVDLYLEDHQVSGTSYACMIASCYCGRVIDYYSNHHKRISFNQMKRLLKKHDQVFK